MITENIATLVNYGIAAGLVDEADRIYTTNRLLELFELEEYDEPAGEAVNDPSTFELEKHADWVEEFLPKYDDISKDNVMDIIKKEVGIVFEKVLEHAGVYKRNEEGMEAFQRFIDSL